MKEDSKAVTDSVTEDITSIEENMLKLSKTQKKEIKPDVYAEKLPVIIEELRSQDKQVVKEQDWYKYTALTTVPAAGAVYMMLQGDEKNLNKKNYCLAAFKTNLVYTAVFIIIALLLFFTGRYTGKSNVSSEKAVVSDERNIDDDMHEDITNVSERNSVSSSDEIKQSEYYAYNESSKTLDITVEGVKMTYPVTAKQLKDTGYTYMSQASQPHSQALMSSYSSKSGTKIALTITLSDTAQDEVKCSEMQVNFSSNTEFLGLTNKSDIDKVRSVFVSADKEDISDYSDSTKTGSIVYSVGIFKISVSFKNGAVSSVTIK
jgi:hypothetical protein